MRKVILGLAAASLVVSANAFADEYVKGGFEASGHVNAGFGWQHWSKNTASLPGNASLANGQTANYGVLGEIADPVSAGASAKDDNFSFFVEQVELDLMKTLGENIKVRTDLDFSTGATLGAAAVAVEQAYVTTNVPVGNGGEFLVGAFNAPVGFESVDVNENSTFSRSAIFHYLRPQNVTGAKFYIPWTDSFDWHFYLVNDLNGGAGAGSDVSYVPSVGTRFGYNWGDEAQMSTIGLSLLGGFEANGVQKYGDMSYMADVDWNWWATDAFAFGGEAIYRVDNSTKASGAKDGMAFGGLLNFNYAFSDVWDGTLKYAYVNKLGKGRVGTIGNLFGLGSNNNFQSHEISLAGQYYITDGAKVQAEGKFDYLKLKGAASKTYNYGAAMNFAYEF